jgi:hypothetical protein
MVTLLDRHDAGIFVACLIRPALEDLLNERQLLKRGIPAAKSLSENLRKAPFFRARMGFSDRL